MVEGNATPTLQTAAHELQLGLQGLLGRPVPVGAAPGGKGRIRLRVAPDPTLGREGYRISSQKNGLEITGPTDAAVLYGCFALLRQVQTGQRPEQLSLSSQPRIEYRLLNHWDNPNGTVERGYAGSSIWKWLELPDRLDPRYQDYARANASIGINGVVLNNVNASARYLTAEYLQKVAALAGVMRPYGIRVYLSVFWAAPKVIGGLPTSDPWTPRWRSGGRPKPTKSTRSFPTLGAFW
nr:alpha-glucuronidase family glycosyl hydrolase [Hymenobacter sp. 5516J-16]